MEESGIRRKPSVGRNKIGLRHNWCCSSTAPASPDHNHQFPRHYDHQHSLKSPSVGRKSSSNPTESPLSSRLGLGFIDRRRILSPGRVSPIDSSATPYDLDRDTVPFPPPAPPQPLPEEPQPIVKPEAVDAPGEARDAPRSFRRSEDATSSCCDVRLSLRGKSGERILMDLHSEVLCSRSSMFSAKISESWAAAATGYGDAGPRRCWVEVADVTDVDSYKEAIELMYERNITGRLIRYGVSRSIRILEVCLFIMFEVGVRSCLQYLEAVPWSEQEEEALQGLYIKYKFDNYAAQDVLARLGRHEGPSCQKLTMHLLQSVVRGADDKARKQLKSLVQGLLSKSSVYQKDPHELNREEMYNMCRSFLRALLALFSEATTPSIADDQMAKTSVPLVRRIALQVDNLTWLLEILIEKQMAEEFVVVWADQPALMRMYQKTPAMIRYEISRVSASLFLAVGRGRLQCTGSTRCRFVETWFGPMLTDFGWLQRCSKGLDMRLLEDSIGQTVLTLPMKNQQSLLMGWFEFFTKQSSECPNLSKAFQIWWRRSFAKTPDVLAVVPPAPG